MSRKVMTEWGELPEPNQDDSLSIVDKLQLRNAMVDILEIHPIYKSWIYAVYFTRETFKDDLFVSMYVCLNDVEIDHIDALDIEKNILNDSKIFDIMLYKCDVIGSLGYNKDNLSEGHIVIESLLREEKINSILRD